jgi:hypothetical protein
MVEIYPVVKVLNLEEMGVLDFNPGFNGYFIYGFPTVNVPISIGHYGTPDFSKSATLSVYGLPADNIEFKNFSFSVLRLDNSFNYVSSGGAYRNAYIKTFKIPHMPVYPSGSGQVVMVWKTPMTNVLYANNVETTKSNPLWSIQDTTQYSTTNNYDTTILSFDFGSSAYGDYIAYLGLWSSSSIAQQIMRIYVSNDGTTWTLTGEIFTASTSELYGILTGSNILFRYLKVTLRSAGTSYTAYGRIRKLLIFR